MIKTSIHVPGPGSGNSSSQASGKSGHSKLISLPGQRLFESKLRTPALRALRTSTPPAGSTQSHDWDPSYGFLSPQLRSRRILQPGTSNLVFTSQTGRGSVSSINYPVSSSPVAVNRVMSPAHRILLQEDSRLQRNSPVHLENNNRFVPVSSYPANVYPANDENSSVCSGDQIYSALGNRHRTSSPGYHHRTGSPAISVNQLMMRTGSPACSTNARTGSPASLSHLQQRTASPANSNIYGSPAAMRQSRSAGYESASSNRSDQEHSNGRLSESALYSRQAESSGAGLYERLERRDERSSNGRTPTLTRNKPLLYKGLLMGPVVGGRPRTSSVSELQQQQYNQQQYQQDNNHMVDQLTDRLNPWTLRQSSSADTSDGRWVSAETSDSRWVSADSSMEMEFISGHDQENNKVSPSSQDGEGTLKSDTKSPARRSEIPVLVKSKLKRQAVIASGQSSPCKQAAMTAATTNSPSRLQNAATKLKTRSDYSASPSKLAGSKQMFKNNDYLGGGGGWESTQPTVPTDYSSPSRSGHQGLEDYHQQSPARSLYSSRYSSPLKNNIRKPTDHLAPSLTASPAKDNRSNGHQPTNKDGRRPATAGSGEGSRRPSSQDTRRPATAGSTQDARNRVNAQASGQTDNRKTEKQNQLGMGTRRANQEISSPFPQFRSRHNRNSLDICTEENIYDEPHRLGMSDRSGGKNLNIEQKTSWPGEKMVSESRKHGGGISSAESRKNDDLGSRLIKPVESNIPRIQPKKSSPPGFASQYQGMSFASHKLADGIDTSHNRLDPLDPTPPGTDASISTTLKKGILWTQRKRIFSRWKEKYYILTPDYLHCFKKSESKMSDMGSFDYKIRLTDIDVIELEDRRGYYTINLVLSGEERILLRKPEGIKEWYNTIHQTTKQARERRTEMVSARQFWKQKQLTDTEAMQKYVHSRHMPGTGIATRRILHKGGISPSSYSNASTPSPSPILHTSRLTSPASPLVAGRVVSPPYMLAAPGGIGVKSPLSATGGEIDSGIDSLLTSLSDTSSNYSHRRMISPR